MVSSRGSALLKVWMHPHQLRASFASELARVTNGNLALVAHVLGHQSMATLAPYVAWVEGPEVAAVARMWPEREEEPPGR